MNTETRMGLGVVDGRFSLLALSPKREVIAAAPILVSEGTHFTQVNSLGHIRAALRLLFLAGMSALFQPGSLVRTSVGRFEIIDAALFFRHQKSQKLREILSLSQKNLTSTDLHTVDVVNGKYIRTLSLGIRDSEYIRLTAKHPNGY
jgi:hypothetical protein